jgi:hypothetical protein
MTPMGFRQYARYRGVSLRAVQKAVESRRISTIGEGHSRQIDADQADLRWPSAPDQAEAHAGAAAFRSLGEALLHSQEGVPHRATGSADATVGPQPPLVACRRPHTALREHPAYTEATERHQAAKERLERLEQQDEPAPAGVLEALRSEAEHCESAVSRAVRIACADRGRCDDVVELLAQTYLAAMQLAEANERSAAFVADLLRDGYPPERFGWLLFGTHMLAVEAWRAAAELECGESLAPARRVR